MFKSIAVLFLTATFVFGDQSDDEFNAILMQVFGPNSTTTKAPATSTNTPNTSVTVNKDGENLDAVLQQIFGPKPISTTTTETPTSCTALNEEDLPLCVTSDGKKGCSMQSFNCDSLHEDNIDHLFSCFIDNAATGHNDDPACEIYYSVICCPF